MLAGGKKKLEKITLVSLGVEMINSLIFYLIFPDILIYVAMVNIKYFCWEEPISIKTYENVSLKVNWEGEEMAQWFAVQTWRPDFDPLHPCEKLGMFTHMDSPGMLGTETGGWLRFAVCACVRVHVNKTECDFSLYLNPLDISKPRQVCQW